MAEYIAKGDNRFRSLDKVYQLLAHGRWFSPASSTTKTGRHDIAEILLKMALNTPTNHLIVLFMQQLSLFKI